MDFQQIIRKNARNGQQTIINFLQTNYLNLNNTQAKDKPLNIICFFCAGNIDITAEHVMPKWLFEKDTNRFFNTTINGLSHKYNQTTIKACRVCNNNLLGALERDMMRIFSAHEGCPYFNDEERSNIIRWLEIIDYKYQVFSLVTKFKASKENGYIEFLSELPLSVLDTNIQYSPAKAIKNLRASLHRISCRSKEKNMKSLILFKTKNTSMHFFHKNNDFIFLELPRFQFALFYFYDRTFNTQLEAKDAAMQIINYHY